MRGIRSGRTTAMLKDVIKFCLRHRDIRIDVVGHSTAHAKGLATQMLWLWDTQVSLKDDTLVPTKYGLRFNRRNVFVRFRTAVRSEDYVKVIGGKATFIDHAVYELGTRGDPRYM